MLLAVKTRSTNDVEVKKVKFMSEIVSIEHSHGAEDNGDGNELWRTMAKDQQMIQLFNLIIKLLEKYSDRRQFPCHKSAKTISIQKRMGSSKCCPGNWSNCAG